MMEAERMRMGMTRRGERGSSMMTAETCGWDGEDGVRESPT